MDCVSILTLVGIGILDCEANEGQPPEMTSQTEGPEEVPRLAPIFCV